MTHNLIFRNNSDCFKMLSTSSKSPVLRAELWLENGTNGNTVQTGKLLFDVKIGRNVAREFERLKEV